MKRFAGSAFAITLLIGLPAQAAPDHVVRQSVAQRDEEQRQERPRGERGGGQAQSNRGAATENQGRRGGGAAVEPSPPGRGGNRGEFTGNRPPQNFGQAAGGRGNRGPGEFAQGRGRVAGPVEHGPAQFDKRAFQRNIPAPRRFRVGAFRPPMGWQYRRWTFGQFLPPAYWARPFWITNFWLYDLDRPPFGTEWVRSGPDVLLVDVSTGEILEVVYNVFY